MKLLSVLLLLPFFLLGENLLVNGSFENGLNAWQRAEGDCRPVSDTAAHGTHSLFLQGQRALVTQTVKIQEGVTYELTCLIKGEDIPSGNNQGARIMLEGNQRWQRITSQGENYCDTGTFDWRYAKGRFTAKSLKSDTIKVSPYLMGGGKVWVDNIQFCPVNESGSEVASSSKSFRKNFGLSVKDGWLYPGQSAEDGSKGVRGFFTPGTPVDMHLDLLGSGLVDIALTAKDIHGKTVWQENLAAQSLPCQKTFIVGEAFPKSYYIVEALVKSNGQDAFFCQSGFVVQDLPLEKRDTFYSFGYGVDASFAEAYKRIGVGNISLKLFWDSFYKREADFLVDFNLKTHKEFLESNDFELDIHVHTACRKELRQDDEALKAGFSCVSDRLQRIMSELVTAYAEKTKEYNIATWSAGQEISSSALIKEKYCGSWAEAMSQQVILCRIVSRALRKVSPEMPYWIGANNQLEALEPYERIVLEDMKDEFDGYLIDGYTGNWDLAMGNVPPPENKTLEFLEKASALAVSVGKTPVIRNNEVGYAVLYGSPLDSGLSIQQAEYTARSIILNRVAGALSYALFRPNDTVEANESNPEARSMNTIWRSILPSNGRVAGVPLPGAAMYATLARELAFVKCTDRIQHGKFYAYVFQREDGKSVAAIWNSEKNSELLFDFDKSVNMITMYGEESVCSGNVKATVSSAPFYLVAEEPTQVLAETIRTALSKSAPLYEIAALRENEKELAVFCKSYAEDAIKGLITVEGYSAAVPVTLIPKLTTKVLVPYASTVRFIHGDKVTEVVDEAPAAVKIHKLSEAPVLDGSEEWLKDVPHFMLQYPDDIYPRSALQPEKAYFKTDYSTDKHNISAECRLAYDDENLYLAVKVDDPCHYQSFSGTDLWRADCLQFALATKNVPPEDVCDADDSQRKGLLNYAIALHDDGRILLERMDGQPSSAKLRGNVTRKGDWIFYEVAIPWKALDFTPHSGDAVRMGFVIFDAISSTAKEPPYWLSFAQGVAGVQDASKFAPAILE